jgi:hypothetical protein
MPTGRHKGKTLDAVLRCDAPYLSWFYRRFAGTSHHAEVVGEIRSLLDSEVDMEVIGDVLDALCVAVIDVLFIDAIVESVYV